MDMPFRVYSFKFPYSNTKQSKYSFSTISIKILYLFLQWFSNFRRNRTVPHRTELHSISSYQTQTTPNYFYNKTRVRGEESNHRTAIKNLELFLKNRVFLKNTMK